VGDRSGAQPGRRLAEAAGFRAFYGQALPVVYGYLLARCGGGVPVAEDLTQETFMAAARWLRRGGEVEAPMPWIVGIAKRKLLDHLRREERNERRLRLAWEARPAEDPAPWSDESRERALHALASVSARQRAALALRYLDGLGVEEVARTLGQSVHATESLLARGRESFKRAWAEAAE
jgi:RNA polymerase sigma-70 factor, ECF subfamily